MEDDFDVPISNWLKRKPTKIRMAATRIDLNTIPTDQVLGFETFFLMNTLYLEFFKHRFQTHKSWIEKISVQLVSRERSIVSRNAGKSKIYRILSERE